MQPDLLGRPPRQEAPPATDDDFFEAAAPLRALHHLQQALSEDDRLVVLSGDEGAGKTTLVRRLLRGLDHRHAVWCVSLSAAPLPGDDLLRSLARAFGAPADAVSDVEVRTQLLQHLARLGRGRRVLAVIDDAHALPAEALREVSELTHRGPLHALLVGRPALPVRLDQWLPQDPASLSCHLDALDERETAAYVLWRLRRDGWTGAPRFDDEVLALVHRFSRGLPGHIGRLCDRLLRAAREQGHGAVAADVVQRLARPRLDDASIPMLTQAVDAQADDALASSAWAPTSVPMPASDLPPAPLAARPPGGAARPRTAVRPRDRPGRRGRFAWLALALGAVLLGWAWHYFAPLHVDSTMTASPSPAPVPAPAPASHPPPSVSSTTDATPAPAVTPPPVAPRVTPPPQADANTGAPIAPSRSPPPAPVPGPCTANVAALGLCTSVENKP